jgi:hypothetical protein
VRKPTLVAFSVLSLIVVFAVLVSACGGSTAGEAPGAEGELDGKALTEERCVECHDLQRVEAAKKTPEEWKANVERMVDKGAKLNEAEQQAVIEYLSEAYPK